MSVVTAVLNQAEGLNHLLVSLDDHLSNSSKKYLGSHWPPQARAKPQLTFFLVATPHRRCLMKPQAFITMGFNGSDHNSRLI